MKTFALISVMWWVSIGQYWIAAGVLGLILLGVFDD